MSAETLVSQTFGCGNFQMLGQLPTYTDSFPSCCPPLILPTVAHFYQISSAQLNCQRAKQEPETTRWRRECFGVCCDFFSFKVTHNIWLRIHSHTSCFLVATKSKCTDLLILLLKSLICARVHVCAIRGASPLLLAPDDPGSCFSFDPTAVNPGLIACSLSPVAVVQDSDEPTWHRQSFVARSQLLILLP